MIQIVGSRGDVQPFVALGRVLRDTYGHRVRLATHPQFKDFVEENGLEFFSIGGDPTELMAFMVKHPGLMPGLDALKNGEVKRRREGIKEILMGCWRSCFEAGNGLGPPPQTQRPDEPMDESYVLPGDPRDRPFVADAIIANPPSFAHIHIAEKLGIPLHMMFTMPWSPTRAFAHPLANIESTNTDVVMTNYVSYALVEMMTWQGLGDVINRFRTKLLDLEPLSLLWAPGLLNRLRVPTTYCWSPALIPKPADWQNEITIAGFYFLDLASSYIPDPALAAFLAPSAGSPPVYIGFGSIVVDDPDALTHTIFKAASIANVRVLVSKGWGGLGSSDMNVPDNVFMLGNCPHDWLFKHVSAVVHHGGAGTSAAGIKAGKPTVVVPFFGDQPFWGAMIAKAGAGPPPIPYNKLTAENLAAAITEALKPDTQAKAQQLGGMITEERGADVGGKSFHEFLETDKMRCSLAPSRVAVWLVKRTKVRLSALAAAVLVKEGLLKYSDLKLYRPKEYSTEEQPWDPITSVTAALVGDIGTLTMAITDFPREIFKGAKKEPATTEGDTSYETSHSPLSTNQQEQLLASGLESSSIRTPGGPLSSHPPTYAGPDAKSEGGGLLVPSMTPPLTPTSSRPTSRPPTHRSRGSTSSATNIPSSSDRRPLSSSAGGIPSPGGTQVNLDMAIGAGKGVGRVVETGMKMPMNFCMGLARGFRNAPRLYNDDTVRPVEKVTDFSSGLKVASKEFGFGLFDGISGLVTQPLKGAEKEGAAGLIKGFGKGIGGLVLKPAAAFWSIPAYTMQGVHAEVRSIFNRNSLNYIVTSRVVQGKQELEAPTTTVEEQKDIVMRWYRVRKEDEDLGGLYSRFKQSVEKRKQQQQGHQTQAQQPYGASPASASSPDYNSLMASNSSATVGGSSGPSLTEPENDEEFERAIRESVQQTSQGDMDEDARVEAAIRASVKEMRRIAEETRDWKATPDSAAGASSAQPDSSSTVKRKPVGAGDTAATTRVRLPATKENDEEGLADLINITDEEYQALVEEAVQQSLLQQQQEQQRWKDEGFVHKETSNREVWHGDDEKQVLRRAEAASSSRGSAGTPEPIMMFDADHGRGSVDENHGVSDDDDEQMMRRAIEESEREHREQLRQKELERSEEDIVMEYVKKQSLAEEEYRRMVPAGGFSGGAVSEDQEGNGKGKGKEVATEDQTWRRQEDGFDDEELRRALEESLKDSGGQSGESSQR